MIYFFYYFSIFIFLKDNIYCNNLNKKSCKYCENCCKYYENCCNNKINSKDDKSKNENNENNNKKDENNDKNDENDKNNDDIFEKCLNFKDNDFNFPKQYKTINSGFEWKNNNCWIISSIELYLNNPKNQEFLKNNNFDKNNEDDKKYIVLRDILKLLLNNEGNYKLDFTKYYEFFWSELERESLYDIRNKKYEIYSACSILELLGTEDFNIQFNENIINKLYKENIKKNNNFNEVNKMYNKYHLKNDIFAFFFIKIFGEKYKNFILKDNLIVKQNGSVESSINDHIYKHTILYISCKTKNIKTKINEIIKKKIDYDDILKDYNIELFSITFSAPEYHFFTFNYDKFNKKYINLNSYNDKENGKTYDNIIDLLGDNLEITQDGDSHKYYPESISIYISDKNDDIDNFNLSRFIDAQKNDYQNALNEVKNGHKESHWIWYIFPQIDGLGNSEMNKKYSIKSIEEGLEYLKNNSLRTNLIEITKALLEYYKRDNVKKIEQIFENPDNLKLQSSMTLFNYIIENYKDSELKEIYNEFLTENNKVIFKEVLDIYFKSKLSEKSIKIIKKL